MCLFLGGQDLKKVISAPFVFVASLRRFAPKILGWPSGGFFNFTTEVLEFGLGEQAQCKRHVS